MSSKLFGVGSPGWLLSGLVVVCFVGAVDFLTPFGAGGTPYILAVLIAACGRRPVHVALVSALALVLLWLGFWGAEPSEAAGLVRMVASAVIAGIVLIQFLAADSRADTLPYPPSRIFEAMTEAVVAVDRDWRIRYVNPAVQTLSGMRIDDVTGQSLWHAFPALLGGEFHRRYVEATSKNAPFPGGVNLIQSG